MTAPVTERISDALCQHEKAVQCDPSSATLWHQLGVHRERLGMAEEARTAYKEAMRIDPDDGSNPVALARLDLKRRDEDCAKANLMCLEARQLSNSAVAQECIQYLLELGEIAKAVDLTGSVRLNGVESDLLLAVSSLAGGHCGVASMFFNAATERHYYRTRSYCELVPLDRPRVELVIAASPWAKDTWAWEIAFELDRNQMRIVLSPGYRMAVRRSQIVVLRRAVALVPLFWSVWALRRKAKRFMVSVRDTGLDGHLSFCGTDTANLIPDTHFLQSFGYAQLRQATGEKYIPWRQRRPDIIWRGAANGLAGPKPKTYDQNFEWSPRLNLCAQAQTSRYADRLDVGITGFPPHFNGDAETERRKLERFVRQYVPPLDQMQYQYAIDIDGWSNAWSGLFHKLLLGVTVLKVASGTGAMQWFYDRLLPFENYLPVKSDLSNLDDMIAWTDAHPGAAERIATAGNQLGASMNLNNEFTAAVQRLAQ